MLAQRIVSGEIAPDAPLSETKVAAMLNISRAPARRALSDLAASGLIAKAKGRGYVVQPGGAVASAPDIAPPPVAARASWQRIYEEVETELAARIAFGAWRIVEADLAASYGVSRTVARDVLGRLQQRGIVDKDERSHWIAPSLTPGRVRELYEVRAILEPAALRRAADTAPAAEVAGMLADIEDALGRPETVTGALLDRLEDDLHVAFLGHCANHALMNAIRSPQSLLVAHRFLYRWSPPLFAVEPFLPEHHAILESLAAGKVGAAAGQMEAHLLASSERASARVAEVNRTGSCEPLPYLRQTTL
ncbi:MAG: GntR family transcriptional regulator [Acuticoccus sp.]